jgi:hypothetical protein
VGRNTSRVPLVYRIQLAISPGSIRETKNATVCLQLPSHGEMQDCCLEIQRLDQDCSDPLRPPLERRSFTGIV